MMRAQGTSDGATGDIISLETAAAIAAVAVHEATAEEEHTEHLEAAQDAGRIVSWRLHQAPLEMRAEDSRVLSTRVCAIRCTDSKYLKAIGCGVYSMAILAFLLPPGLPAADLPTRLLLNLCKVTVLFYCSNVFMVLRCNLKN